MAGKAGNVPERATASEDTDDTLVAEGWPGASVHPLPRRPASPPLHPKRSLLGVAWIGFTVLGLLAAAAAVVWYLRARPSPLPRQVSVPALVGSPEHAAVSTLKKAGFRIRVIERPGHAARGVVFGQRPAPQTVRPRGSTVTIEVANGQTHAQPVTP